MTARPHSHVVAELVERHDWRAGAEIGVFRGDTLFHLLDTFERLAMLGVDLWVNPPDGRYARFNMPAIGSQVMRKAVGYGNRCLMFHMESAEAASQVVDGSLDFIFIDGDHSYDGFVADLAAWSPKVRPGGMITGHDWHHEGVDRGLAELLPDHQRLDKWVWIADA